MGPIVRTIWKLDRSYVFASFAFAVAFVSSVYLTLAPIFIDEFVDGQSKSYNGIEYVGAEFILLLILPVIVTAAPLLVLPRTKQEVRRNHRINSVVATLVMMVFVVLLFSPIGIYYFPALIFSIASSISLFFGKDRKKSGPGMNVTEVQSGGRSKKDRRSERRGRVSGPGGGRRRRRGG